MTWGQLLVVYLMIGCGVAVAVYLSAQVRAAERAFQVATALVFWPLYLPLLLSQNRDEEPGSASGAVAVVPERDELARAIAQVDAELEGAMRSLDGWAEGVLARERDRLQELRAAWNLQAERIREMDRLLARLATENSVELPGDTSLPATDERLRTSKQAVRANWGRLRQVRDKSFHDLLATLAWVRELVSMIHLAKFTGAPAARAEELVAQIAATVEGLSTLTAGTESLPGPGALKTAN